MFLPSGIPVRARLQVSFHEFKNVDMEAKEIKRESPDFSKRHEVLQGETIGMIAFQAYGDATLWRPIALRNGLDDVRALKPGRRLIVPPLPYRDPESGRSYP